MLTASGEPALTRQKRAVLLLVAEGLTNQKIADRLFISRRTVESHLSDIYDAWGIRRRRLVVQHAVRHGLIEKEELPPNFCL